MLCTSSLHFICLPWLIIHALTSYCCHVWKLKTGSSCWHIPNSPKHWNSMPPRSSLPNRTAAMIFWESCRTIVWSSQQLSFCVHLCLFPTVSMACLFSELKKMLLFKQASDQESIGESIKHLTYKQNQCWHKYQYLHLHHYQSQNVTHPVSDERTNIVKRVIGQWVINMFIPVVDNR